MENTMLLVEQVEKVQVEEQRNGGEEDEPKSFEEIGLDSRLIRALSKKGIEKPTPTQQMAIPYILEGKDVIVKAKTGSGKTFAYLLPLLQKLSSADSGIKKKLAPSAFILVPSQELCQQVYTELLSLLKLCRIQLKAVQLTSSMQPSDKRNALAGLPEILVSTPDCITKCFDAGVLETTTVSDSLETLVLDEADLLSFFGNEDKLRWVTSMKLTRCQCLLMSATTSSHVEKLTNLVLHKPTFVTAKENNDKEEIVPSNIQQFWQFDAGLFDYLIATDDNSQSKENEEAKGENNKGNHKNKKKPKLDAEFGVVRGIDFKKVHTASATVAEIESPKSDGPLIPMKSMRAPRGVKLSY